MPQVQDCLEDEVEDGLNHLAMLEEETRDVLMDLLNRAEVQVTQMQVNAKIQPTVEVDGHCIYKSTLVSQLNGSSFLSKDRLAQIKHTI